MMSVVEAEKIIAQHVPKPEAARMQLAQSLGHVLAQDVLAERDHPPFHRITRDGIAIRFDNTLKDYPIESYAAAGSPRQILSDISHAIEVGTGAPLPDGCDTVVPYEQLHIENNIARIAPDATITKGAWLHAQGADAKRADVLLKKGSVITVPAITILASNGVDNPLVHAKPRIGILTTGNELVDVDAVVADHQICRSNDVTLQAALFAHGFTEVTRLSVTDEKAAIQLALETLLAKCDLLIITGGVSKGSYDYVPDVLSTLGVIAQFHEVAQRPGKPLWFGLSSHDQPVFGLPGNPASCLTCLIRYVVCAAKQMSGFSPTPAPLVTLAAEITPHEKMTVFAPVSSKYAPIAHQGSGDFTSLKDSIGFVELAPCSAIYEAGEHVAFYSWGQL